MNVLGLKVVRNNIFSGELITEQRAQLSHALFVCRNGHCNPTKAVKGYERIKAVLWSPVLEVRFQGSRQSHADC